MSDGAFFVLCLLAAIVLGLLLSGAFDRVIG